MIQSSAANSENRKGSKRELEKSLRESRSSSRHVESGLTISAKVAHCLFAPRLKTGTGSLVVDSSFPALSSPTRDSRICMNRTRDVLNLSFGEKYHPR